jgi:hypothetical protein
MPRHKTVYLVSCAIALAALAGGGVLVVAYGFSPPGWLLRAEMAALSFAALLVGFAGRLPALLPWLRLRPVFGAALVCVGVAAVYLPPSLVISAVLIASGVRLVWAEACELADAEKAPEPTGTAIVRAGGNGVAVTHDPTPALPADVTPQLPSGVVPAVAGRERRAVASPLPSPDGRRAVARRRA